MNERTNTQRPFRPTWAAAGVVMAGAAFAIVFLAKIGPVIWTISAGHGVHSGDLLAIIPTAGSLLCAHNALASSPRS